MNLLKRADRSNSGNYSDKPELPGIQYLRGYAALFVVLDHATGMAASAKYLGAEAFKGALIWGWIGVDIFFIISGFIITYVTLDPRSFKTTQAASTFFVNRAARILPFLWVCVLGYGALKLIGRGPFEFEPYFRSLFLIPTGTVQPNAVWTLRHEALFYCLFGVLLTRARYGIAALMLWLTGSAVVSIFGSSPSGSLLGFIFNPLNFLFATGIICCLITFLTVDKKFRVPPVLLSALACALILVAALLNYDRAHLADVLIFCVLGGCLVCLAARIGNNQRQSVLVKLSAIIGNASYAIYLTHEAIISAVLGFTSKRSHDVSPNIVVPIVAISAVVAGVAAHRFVEAPLIRIVKRAVRAKSSGPTASSAYNPSEDRA